MIKKISAAIIVAVIVYTDGLGQELHFSQYFNSPLNLNPALTGVFDGDTRVYTNFKQQWKSVPVDYRSYDIGGDMSFRTPGNENFFSVGALVNYDQAGDLSLTLIGINLAGSYTLKLGEESFLTPGIGVRMASRAYDNANALTGNQWDGRAYDPSIPAEFIGDESISYFDVNAGLNYRWARSFRQYIDLGIGVYHINGPNDRFKSNAVYDSKRPQRYSVYGMSNLPMSKDLDVIVNALASFQESYRELVLNGQVKLYLTDLKNIAIYAGGGWRLGDAWYPMLALTYNSIYASFSYDFNISDFDIATDGNGGPELSIRYTIAKLPTIYKPCPIY